MSFPRIFIFTLLALLAFAGNSLLCRIALKNTAIDPASFTGIRIIAGALTLLLIAAVRKKKITGHGNWLSAFALFVYAAGFSFAYLDLSAATGALLLFGAVQISMIAFGIWSGERLEAMQIFGLLLAVSGLVILLLPGLAAPSLSGSLLMILAGIAWGVYSLRGKSPGDPGLVTTGNFLRAVPFAIVLSLLMLKTGSLDNAGIFYAICSGAITSGIGYAIWYAVLPYLKAVTAATLQLSVPVIAAAGAILLLGESISLRLILAAATILGGIGVFIAQKKTAD